MLRFTTAVCLAVALFGGSLAVYLDDEWAAFKLTYGKQYHSEDEAKRRVVWENNLDYITKHNLEADRGVHTFWVGMNQFGDLTVDEFAATMMMSLPEVDTAGSKFKCAKYPADNSTKLPGTVDWREKGAVTPIINQGQCGSSWAFSATVAMEGLHQIKTGKLVSLSASNLMDCSGPEGNQGCEGGYMDQAFAYVIKNKGIDTTAAYPYKPMNQKCHFTKAGVGATIKGCMDIPKGDEMTMKKAIAMEGPVATAVYAASSSFQMYKSGVYSSKECMNQYPDHGIPVVGYGTADNMDYWILKNSWSDSWGMKGYMQLARNADNMCAIASVASFPTA